jgi:hypothetical protein
MYIWDNTQKICKLIQIGPSLTNVSVKNTSQQEITYTREKLKRKIVTKKDDNSIKLINNGDLNKLDDRA